MYRTLHPLCLLVWPTATGRVGFLQGACCSPFRFGMTGSGLLSTRRLAMLAGLVDKASRHMQNIIAMLQQIRMNFRHLAALPCSSYTHPVRVDSHLSLLDHCLTVTNERFDAFALADEHGRMWFQPDRWHREALARVWNECLHSH